MVSASAAIAITTRTTMAVLVALCLGLVGFGFGFGFDEVSTSITATISNTAPNHSQQQQHPQQHPQQHRSLSMEFIAGYEPKSQVTDHNAMDLDQEAMEEQLSFGNQQGFDAALRMYTEGGNSKSVAEVQLTSPLPENIYKGTVIRGVTSFGSQVAARAYEDNPQGLETLKIQYQTSDTQAVYVQCRVGANPVPHTKGCLAANATIALDDGRLALGYTYDPLANNVAKRTLQKLSVSAKKKMGLCGDACSDDRYRAFVEYYGYFDYGNQIVMAAFEGRSTTGLVHGDPDFGQYGFAGRAQIIKKATAYLILWMAVNHQLEDAVQDCWSRCSGTDCTDHPAYSWDQAVAFYTGMLEGDNGQGHGKLLHALADAQCAYFRTCGSHGDSVLGTSQVNREILKQFKVGQAHLTQGNCAEAGPVKEKVQQLLVIPLIQGTLRYAYKTDHEAYSEVTEAEAAIFAMALVPLVHRCNPEAGQTIAAQLPVGQKGSADFFAVQQALESTYDCLGVTSHQVGGLWDSAMETYYAGAEPLDSAAVATTTVLRGMGAAVVGLATATSLLVL